MTSKENITTTIKISLAELDTIIDSLDFKTSLNVRYESGYINRFVLLLSFFIEYKMFAFLLIFFITCSV